MAQTTMMGQTEARAYLEGIERTLRHIGTGRQGVSCALLTAFLCAAQLPGGGYACAPAMFAVLLHRGFCVPAGFIGMMGGFAVSFGCGELSACWQLPCAILLWLSSGVWAADRLRTTLAAAAVCMAGTAAAQPYVSPHAVLVTGMTGICAAALAVLYDGAALCVCRREELDGETRPLCVAAVAASLTAAALHLPMGQIAAMAMAVYLTLEHAHAGGAVQALLSACVLGGVLMAGTGSIQPAAMLIAGGLAAGQIRTGRRSVCALLMMTGMAAACAALGTGERMLRTLLMCMPGVIPFLLLTPPMRSAVTRLVKREEPQELTQSEAVGVRCVQMVHAWAGLYEQTARMMNEMAEEHRGNTAAEACAVLMQRTAAAAHRICERTLEQIVPDDEAYKRIRYALLRAGLDRVRVMYAVHVGQRLEVMIEKPEEIAAVTLAPMLSRCCGAPMRPGSRAGLSPVQAIYEQAPELEMEVGMALRSGSGEEVAGDSYVSRRLPGGRHMLALSDGMGSGVGARQESHAALTLMVESLKAGYTRQQALSVVNTLMLMSTGREMYATMDLCVCDLHTGETAFDKLGACVSYVVRDGQVRSIGADTLPVGVLPEVESSSLRMTLKPGDVLVMMTDGIRDAFDGGEEALRETVLKGAWLHPQSLSEKILDRAAAHEGPKDDMTVLCARIRHAVMR